MAMMVSYAPGKCDNCKGMIGKGDFFQWGQRKGARVHVDCTPKPKVVIPLSDEQKALVDFAVNDTRNGAANAVAGSGKTRTVEACCEAVPAHLTVGYQVFAKKNKLEADQRLPARVDVATFNGRGFQALKKTLPNAKFDEYKAQTIWQEFLLRGTVSEGEATLIGDDALRLFELARQIGIDALVPDTFDEWMSIVEHFAFEIDGEGFDGGEEEATERAINIAKALLAESNSRLDTIDFGDQQYLAIKLGAPLPKFDLLFVDEAQDTNRIQRAMLHRMLAPRGRIIVVGDHRQAIFGFRGADSDAMNALIREFQCVELPLTVNYRCARSIIAEAQTFCPEIRAHDGATEGVVAGLTEWPIRDFLNTDVILCRTTAPLITLAYRLIGANRGCVVLGRDIGLSLVSLVKKLQGRGKRHIDMETLLERLDSYQERETKNARKKNNESKVQAIEDKCDSLRAAVAALPEDARTVIDLIRHIESLFAEAKDNDSKPNIITLCTVHRSKGLEWPRVFVLDPHLMPSKWATTDWQIDQERNLQYVAATRAMTELYYVSSRDII